MHRQPPKMNTLQTNNRWKRDPQTPDRKPRRASTRAPARNRRNRPYSSRATPSRRHKKVIFPPKLDDEKEFPALNIQSTKARDLHMDFMKVVEQSVHKPAPKHVYPPPRTPRKKKEIKEDIDYDDPDYTEYMDRIELSDEEGEDPSSFAQEYTPTQVKIGGFNPPVAPPIIR